MSEPAKRPNIIVILVDDMGYSDIGPYGSEIRTPTLDRLAAGGARFSQMYNCARCCPTRASLLTGLYPHQAGVGQMVNDRGVGPAYQGYLRDDCVTIAEALKPAGYRTLMSGKWHVGGPYDAQRPDAWRPGTAGFPTPYTRGFDEHYGTLAGAANYFDPYTLIHNDTFIEPTGDDYYYTDAISENACRMIEASVADETPFFAYVAYTAPHWPLHAFADDIERYRGQYRQGWDALRTGRHEQLKGLGVLDRKWEISPRDESAPPWADAAEKDWQDARMAVYAAQIDRMDQGVGRIVATLERLGQLDDTLILFLSDNGGCAEFLAEDGHVARYGGLTRDGRPIRIGNRPDIAPGDADTYMSYELPWANASNSPFRLFKHWVHEGGIATPLVAHWPARFAGGALHHQTVHVIDIMATCLEAAGAIYPAEHHGRAVTPLEGESFLPLLEGRSWSRQRPLFWEHEGNRAVRLGPWKLVSQDERGQWELYNMDEDRTELHDLGQREPGRLTELQGLYEQWAQRVGVVPWDQLRRRRR